MNNEVFDGCVAILTWLARLCHCSYEAINVLIFCVLWPMLTVWLATWCVLWYTEAMMWKKLYAANVTTWEDLTPGAQATFMGIEDILRKSKEDAKAIINDHKCRHMAEIHDELYKAGIHKKTGA